MTDKRCRLSLDENRKINFMQLATLNSSVGVIGVIARVPGNLDRRPKFPVFGTVFYLDEIELKLDPKIDKLDFSCATSIAPEKIL